MKDKIYLIGFMGTGKTTISEELVRQAKLEKIDTDEQIEKIADMQIKEIFEKHGEEYFRELETRALLETAELSNVVISCGGGIVLRKKNIEIMKENGVVVLLTASPQTIYERVRHSNTRPVLKGNMNAAYIEELMKKREAYYEAAKDIVVVTDAKTTAEIAEEIIKKTQLF